MAPRYRLPNTQQTTTSFKEYVAAWRKLAAPIEKVTGWRLFGFDPGITFVTPDNRSTQHVNLDFLTALTEGIAELLPMEEPSEDPE